MSSYKVLVCRKMEGINAGFWSTGPWWGNRARVLVHGSMEGVEGGRRMFVYGGLDCICRDRWTAVA